MNTFDLYYFYYYIGNIMDGNFNCTRSKANYRDGCNGYSRDNLNNGPSEYISPRFEKRNLSSGQPALSISHSDYIYTGPFIPNDTRYLDGKSPVLAALNDQGVLVGK